MCTTKAQTESPISPFQKDILKANYESQEKHQVKSTNELRTNTANSL